MRVAPLATVVEEPVKNHQSSQVLHADARIARRRVRVHALALRVSTNFVLDLNPPILFPAVLWLLLVWCSRPFKTILTLRGCRGKHCRLPRYVN